MIDVVYEQILVPLDGSSLSLEALATACRVAEMHSAALWLVTVVGPAGTSALPANVFAAADRVLEECAFGGEVAERTTIEADPGDAIAELDRAHPEALVCMTSRGSHPLGRALLGSVAHEVVRRSDQAILLVGPRVPRRHDGPVRRLLVCLDGGDNAEAVLPWGVRWQGAGAQLHLVRVHYPHAPHAAGVPPDPATITAARYLGTVASRLADEGHDATIGPLVHTDPATALIELARSYPDDLFALATGGPNPLEEFIVGSTFSRLLRNGALPILVVSHRSQV